MFRLRTLSGLLAFDAAARHSSLTLAARELGRTQSAVSQQVKALEEELGLQLFVRRPKEVTLTPEGRAFAETLQRSLKDIEATVTSLQQREEPNVLRLTTYQSFAIHWLIPRLPRFNMRHPEIDVRINADDQRLDLRAQGMDLAIRVGTVPSLSVILGEETFAPIYAPSLSPDRRIEAGQVTDHRLLAHEHAHLWAEWFELNGLDIEQVNIATDYSHSGLLVQAASAGGGVALAPPLIAADAIASGRLCCVPGRPLPTGYFYYLEAAREKPPEKVRLFFDWMQEEMAEMERESEAWFR